MRLYGRDPTGRYYEVRNGIWGRYREPPRGLPGKARPETALAARRDHRDRILSSDYHLPERAGRSDRQ